MIDDKKIEDAARYYCNNRYPASQDAPFIAEGFRHGAKWMQKEFLKNLWHPASEVPRNDYTDILIVCKEPQRPIVLNIEDILDESADDFASYNDMWMHLCDVYKITKYCYIGDLFPKKGGNHD